MATAPAQVSQVVGGDYDGTVFVGAYCSSAPTYIEGDSGTTPLASGLHCRLIATLAFWDDTTNNYTIPDIQ